MMPHKTKIALVCIGLAAVLVVGLILCTDTGNVRTKAFIAWDRYERSQQRRPAPRPPRDDVHLMPDCGRVFPACETWPPERLEAMLDKNPDCEVAYIWAALAYRKQKRWADFWSVCDAIDTRWPGHHFPKAMRRHCKKLGIPEPE